MTIATAPPPSAEVVHRERADVALLTGPAAGEIVAAALAGEGVTLESWILDAVHHRPGAGVTVGLAVRWAAGAGPVRADYLCATTADLGSRARARAGLVTVADGDRTLSLWRHPADPMLPGLEPACRASGADVELVAYRPLRRAVVRIAPRRGAASEPATTYRKVVRPRLAGALRTRHEILRSAGLPVPAILAATSDGVVTLEALGGRSLAHALASDGAAGLDPQAFLDLLDALPDPVLALPRRPSWSELARPYAAGAALALPGSTAELLELGDLVADLVTRTDPGPVVATHGDFYEANLLTTGGAITGVLDVDSVGPGYRVDDLACLLGHAAVLPCLAPEIYPTVPAAVRRWISRFDDVVDPAALRARIAGVVLSLVAGAVGTGRGGDDTRRADAVARAAVARHWAAEASAAF